MLCLRKARKELLTDSKLRLWHQSTELPAEWHILASQNVFFSQPYLKILESTPPSEMQLAYWGSYNQEGEMQCIGIMQLIYIEAKEAYSPSLPQGNLPTHQLERFFKTKIPKHLSLLTLVGGNLLLSGEHAFLFNPNLISYEQTLNVWLEAIKDYKNKLKKEGRTVNLTLLKDFDTESTIRQYDFSKVREKRYHQLEVQPNMTLTIDASWLTFDHYLDALTSKARKRAKRAQKKFNGIEKCTLSFEEVKQHETAIYQYYANIAHKATFNTFLLHREYFSTLKQYLKEDCVITAYFQEEQLVGFSSLIHNHGEWYPHFLGYSLEVNTQHQLYLNMLYDMLDFVILKKGKIIHYGRTAMEIKSSIGAIPQGMDCFLKHSNKATNTVAKLLFHYLKPKETWTPRSPFKKEN